MKTLYLTFIAIVFAINFSYAQWTGGPTGPVYYNGGNVGIGTASPSSALTVGTTSSFPWTGSRVEINSTLRVFDGTSSSHGMRFGFTSNVPYIDAYRETVGAVNLTLNPSGGNVGIGTINPLTKLQVNFGDVAGNSINLIGDGTTNGAALATNWNTGNAYLDFRLGGNTAALYTNLRITNTGALGIGMGAASPTNALSFGNLNAKKIWIENTATDVVGRNLTVAAGSTVAGTSVSDVVGGNMVIQSGLGTGIGASTIFFQTGTTLATGTALQSYSTKVAILGNGNVGIGTTTPDQLLSVNGTIHSKEVIVSVTGFPDYVFKPAYHLPTLNEVKIYIDQNHHLLDMPTEAEVIKNGLKVGETEALLTKKVEELTLYLIEKDKQVSDQKMTNQTLQAQITNQQKEIDELKKLISKR